MGARFSSPVENVPGVHQASYAIDTWSFPWVKRPRCGVDLPTTYSADVKERVQLYHYSPPGTSWPVIG